MCIAQTGLEFMFYHLKVVNQNCITLHVLALVHWGCCICVCILHATSVLFSCYWYQPCNLLEKMEQRSSSSASTQERNHKVSSRVEYIQCQCSLINSAQEGIKSTLYGHNTNTFAESFWLAVTYTVVPSWEECLCSVYKRNINWEDCKASAATQAGSEWGGTMGRGDVLC